MSPTTSTPSATATATALDIVRDLFADVEPRDFEVRLWDGTRWTPEGAGAPAFTLVLERPSTLRRLLRTGSESALLEAYLAGDLSVQGDIFAVPDVGRAVIERQRPLTERARLALRLLRLPREPAGDGDVADADVAEDGAADVRTARLRGELHSIERDRAAVTYHYDLSNRFYGLFLDPRMVYSCAVFAAPDEPLERAQLRKLDLICRKLRIRPGDRLLDVGCGWGALILHAAREYGADALGITVSERQADLARQRIRDAGLEDRCRVVVRDYRTMGEAEGGFDRVASVGMFEHVGRARAGEYFRTIFQLLRPGGVYLHHAITGNPRQERPAGASLSDRYVFPDHELIPIGETLTAAEMAGFDVRDVEGLGEHYALTLRRWVAALEGRRSEAVSEVGEATVRAWLLVFAGAAVDFEAGRQGLAQALLVRPREDGSTGLPLGRWDWYDASPRFDGPGGAVTSR